MNRAVIAERIMQTRALAALLISLQITAFALSADDLNQVRTWTNQAGETLRATLLGVDTKAETARMRRDDGRVFTIEWDRLAETDQSLIRAQSKTDHAASVQPARTEKKATVEIPLPKKFKLRKVPMVTQKGNFCVPASAAMIAGYHGIKTDQDQVAQLSSEASISNEGTYPSDMLLAMGKLGFEGRPLLWKDEDTFYKTALPAIRRTLVETGPIYISFRPGVFGGMGHGCVIIGYDDRQKEMIFHNPWGHVFEKEYEDVAAHGYGVVFIDPPKPAPTASDVFIARIQKRVPRFDGDMLQLGNHLKQAGQPFELVWCSRRDSRDDKRFAIDTARRDGRKILELAFERNPAVLIPASPNGKTESYLFVTRPPEGGAHFLVREITPQGWSPAEPKTLGSLTREWATAFTIPDRAKPVWELPMIELSEDAR
jgi:hypothetical protein